ncbi:MAG: hypothetical protein LW850_20250 [Planctomycetaceae bacterium]|jgi:hypothetical protein|nr:hypothetical protein [Planctomycetaceae bacterium]MCE2812726.1 hypothetical protein [Planctomycetaceae bacterium]
MRTNRSIWSLAFALLMLYSISIAQGGEPIKIALFDVDATPPVGSAMAYQPVRRIDELTLRCRGIVILGANEPIVLCAVDWIGIANEGHDAFREALAKAAGTIPERVAVHTLHQHDAPGCDFTAEKIIAELQIQGYSRFDGDFHREVIQKTAAAIQAAIPNAVTLTHYGVGEAVVKEVASQRRIAGADGKIRATRTSSTKDPAVRAEPEGVIDPVVTLLSFWKEDQPVAVLSYYACHPQSYYLRGIPSPDFPGIARFIRGQDLNNTMHVHFNGAGGNVTAGKYNDGSETNRMILATRLADAMRQAHASTQKAPLSSEDVTWKSIPVSLPTARHLIDDDFVSKLKEVKPRGYVSLADQLAYLRRVQAGHKIDISCLGIGKARCLHMPGELFVEYQLAAKAMRKDLTVMMAAYGDYGPGYIGTQIAYSEGGYETQQSSSCVDPSVEPVLIDVMSQLLEFK